MLPDRICLAEKRGDPLRPFAHNVTIVRLELPAARVKHLLQQEVRVTGPLSASRGGADTAIVMKVKRLRPVAR